MASQGVFQHTAARRRLARWSVSNGRRSSFNTQPPEGGWTIAAFFAAIGAVSTHSRPKAAGDGEPVSSKHLLVSTHSRPKAAGDGEPVSSKHLLVSTHSRPKAAGPQTAQGFLNQLFQHTAARRRLVPCLCKRLPSRQFQHTAARRRLAAIERKPDGERKFQHTAARRRLGNERCKFFGYLYCFNTQPPEGGWDLVNNGEPPVQVSTHSRPKAAGLVNAEDAEKLTVSTHSRPKAAGPNR